MNWLLSKRGGAMNGDLSVWLILGGGLVLALLGKSLRSDLLFKLGNLIMFGFLALMIMTVLIGVGLGWEH